MIVAECEKCKKTKVVSDTHDAGPTWCKTCTENSIDPFDANGQFCDQGDAYRSVLYVGNDEEKRIAEKTKQAVAKKFKRPVATEIEKVTTFGAAEDYHQDYHNTNTISYKIYKWNCGRAQRLKEIWGSPPA